MQFLMARDGQEAISVNSLEAGRWVRSHNCDRILENGSKSHIFISLYLSLPHEKYRILNNIS